MSEQPKLDENTLPEEFENILVGTEEDVVVSKDQTPLPDIEGV